MITTVHLECLKALQAQYIQGIIDTEISWQRKKYQQFYDKFVTTKVSN